MIKKTIEISNGPARLSLAHGQLVIERHDYPQATVPCEDIGILIIDQQAVTYTHQTLVALLANGAAVILCDATHHPAGLFLPLDAHSTQALRHRVQVEAALPLKKQAWKQVVAAKLRQQGEVLELVTGNDSGLHYLASQVKSGDPENLEGQGAQRYWRQLLGADFRRDREGGAPNHLLNYGYAILRAATARAVAAAGLIPTLGIHHRHRANAFCLADDLMEPYRPYVDLKVVELIRSGLAVGDDIGRPAKQVLLSLFNETVEVGGRRSPIFLALHATASSLAISFEKGALSLALPEGLFLRPEGENASPLGSG